MRLVKCHCSDALHEIEDAFGQAAFFAENVWMIVAVSALENPRRRRKSVRTSSRDALMPLMNGTGEELAKFSNAGAASWAKRTRRICCAG